MPNLNNIKNESVLVLGSNGASWEAWEDFCRKKDVVQVT